MSADGTSASSRKLKFALIGPFPGGAVKRSLTLKTLGVSLALWASGGCRATDPTPDAPAPLAAPVVSQPTNGVRVTAPLAVAGQTSAGYRISLTVFRSGEPLAQRTVLPQSDGQWSASVPFAAADGAIQLWVESVDGALRSAPVVVDLMLTGGDARLAAPTVTEPDGDATVFGAVGVRGTASAAAPISVLVRTDNQAIGGGATVANASGHFAVTIPYDANVNVGQTLTVQVVQSGENGVSTATEVDVVHGVTTELTGTVTDPNPHPGADVFVRAYRADADGLISVGEAAIFVSDGAAFENRNFSLDLPAGDYVIRAFRDAGSPTGNGPDTEPSLGIDAQSPPEPIRVTDTPISLDLTIQPPAFAPPLPIFDVYTRNESIDTYSPPADDDDNGSVVGAESADRGQCGGFYLRIEVESTGTVLQDPKVRLPDGSVVSPLDDGGCGFDGDNRGFSYDRQASDGQFTYGVPEPSEALTGDFALAVHGPDEQIGVLVDRIERIKRLSRRLVLVSPSGLDRVSVVRPELTWTTVADAVSYRIDVNGGGVNRSVSGLTAPRYTLEEDLADASSVQVQIDAADGDRAMGQDVDAESWGIPNRFVVDTTGLRSTKIDGTIVNTTGLTAPIYIEAGTSFSPSSTAWLTADATTFSLFAIAESNDADGYVESYLDVDGTGTALATTPHIG